MAISKSPPLMLKDAWVSAFHGKLLNAINYAYIVRSQIMLSNEAPSKIRL